MTSRSLTLALMLLGTTAAAAEPARYSVVFEGTWSASSHPLDYPTGAHFSGLIGATHGNEYSLFSDGGLATSGLERLAEKGAHSPLDAEIRQAIAAGTAGALIEGQPIFGPPGRATAEFEIGDRHPFVSLVAMIAPSPDWFAGLSGVPLREDGQWVPEKKVTLYAWDAGTDHGRTYQAADADAMPRERVRLNDSPHFVAPVEALIPVGTVIFTKR